MIKRYRKALSLLDSGRKIKEMFRFIPIERMDESEQNFFAGEWDKEEKTDEEVKKDTKEKIKELSATKVELVGRDDMTVLREIKTESEKDYSTRETIRFEGGWEHQPSADENTVTEDNITENIVKESIIQAAAPAERASKTEKGIDLNSAFDEKVWLAQENVYSVEKNLEKMTQIFNAEQVIAPVLTRIERSAERIEQTVKLADERERIRTLNEEVLFKERLEGVLRAEMLRNGFDYEEI